MHKPSDVYIKRAAAFLPNLPVGNDEMEAVLGMSGDTPSRVRKMILRSNAITSRYYAIDPKTRRATHSNTELAALAVRGLLAQGLRAEEIDSLCCGTSYPDQIMPGHAVMVHGLLPEIPPCEVVSTAGVCVAGMAAMKQAERAGRTGECRGGLRSGGFGSGFGSIARRAFPQRNRQSAPAGCQAGNCV